MHSKRIRAADSLAVARLSHECRDLGDDPYQWREHLGEGLHELLHAPLVIQGELGGLADDRPTELGSVAWGWHLGLHREGWEKARELFRANPRFSRGLNEFFARLREGAEATFAPDELVGPTEWQRSVEREQVCRVAGVEATLLSFRELAVVPGEYTGVLACRAIGERPFSEREKAVLVEEQRLIAPLIGRSLARFREPSAADLSPRAREVLRRVLEGDSDKQIARRLEISPYTVNQYTKLIYRHFGVQGRAELLARWVRRGLGLPTDPPVV